MGNLNKCLFIGRLTRDPDGRRTNSGKAVTSFGLAVNSGYGDNQETAFIEVTTFDKTAEFIRDHLRTGAEVFVEARVKLEKYEDRDGKQQSKTRFYAHSVQALGGRQDSLETKQTPGAFPGRPVTPPTMPTPPPFPGASQPAPPTFPSTSNGAPLGDTGDPRTLGDDSGLFDSDDSIDNIPF